jgi:hypothetical protein
MSFFSRKQEVSLEDFCRDYYDNYILNPKIGEANVGHVMPDYVRTSIIEADDVFAHIEAQKFADEIIILRFELFALAWLHQFGEKLAVAQSTFTYHYLHEKGRDDIWDGMEYYNKAISHSTTVEKNATERGKVELAYIYKKRADLADKYIGDAKTNELDLDDEAFLVSIGRPLNRLGSEHAWKQRITAYYLMLAICHRLGLGSGPDYIGPNEEAQFRLTAFILGFYGGAQQSWDKVEIKG